MGKIFDTFKSAFEKQEINFESNSDQSSIRLGFNTEAGGVEITIAIDEEREWYIILAKFPNTIPLKYIDKVYPIINKANLDSILTMWCIDPEDGQLSVRCSSSTDKGCINEEQVMVYLYNAVGEVENRYDEILKGVYSK